MTWFNATSVTVNNGQTVVSVNAGDDIQLAQESGGLIIGNNPPVEIKRSYLDGSNNKKIELRSPWPYQNQSAQPAVAFPTDGDLAAATAVLKQLIDGLALATQAQAEQGTNNTAAMTALRVKQAVDFYRAFATNAEAQAGTNAAKVVSPAALKAAIDSQRAYASKAEAEAGTDNSKVLTALRVKEAIAAQRPFATQNEMSAGTATDKVANPATTTVIVRDAYRTSVEANSGGKNTVVYDAQGNPNVMVVVPRFNYEDLNLPLLELGTGTPTAFLTNGVPRSEILIAKYLASTPSGTSGCSVLPGFQPRTSVNFDAAKSLCTNKGAGWHLLSRHEWAAIALWSLANNTIPRGNTFHGRAHDNPKETARRFDNGLPGDSGGTGRTDTGKGPATWAHTHTDFGIHDLVGNVNEWLDQLKLQDGRIICTPDNQPDMAEASWPATTAWLDASTASGGSNVLSNSVTNRVGAIGDNQNAGNSAGNTWQLTSRAAGYTPVELLRRLLVEPAVNSGLPAGYLSARNFGERMPLAGGNWDFGSSAGLSALNLGNSRSRSISSLGFRPALFV